MSELHYWRPPTPNPRVIETDVCIYGGNAAGVVAAVQLAREGKRSVIIEPNAHLGGLTSGGLSCTDFGNKAAIGGLSVEFYQAMGAHYGDAETEWYFEPKVAEAQFDKWLAEAGVEAHFREFVASVQMDGGRIASLTTESGLKVRAAYFIDCSYEGDLLAKAGCTYHVGREDNTVYGETLNGVQCRDKHQFQQPVDPYRTPGDRGSGLLAGIEAEDIPQGTGDKSVQAYNFRMCLTQQKDNRILFNRPADYNPHQFELLGRYMLVGGAEEIRRKYDRIRGNKVDKNNHGALSTDYIGGNHAFPEANNATRERIFQEHVSWHRGLFWFLQTDERVPREDREWVASWGLAADEFPRTGGWPHQLYIRESRRLIGDYVATEADCTYGRKCPDPIGLAAYTMDSHNCRRFVRDGRVLNEGDVQVQVGGPYGVSWRSIIPKAGECENLLVPVCLSASHIAYGSIRMEPVFMTMGQTAGSAASLALDSGKPALHALDYAALRARLEKNGQIMEWQQ